jgi:hypothetical protein
MYGFIPGYIFGFAYLLFSIYGMKAKNDNMWHTLEVQLEVIQLHCQNILNLFQQNL